MVYERLVVIWGFNALSINYVITTGGPPFTPTPTHVSKVVLVGVAKFQSSTEVAGWAAPSYTRVAMHSG